ncbi:hypothetical protein K2173_000364 [Erythroxylum novogranatense]|uniref:ARM repeat superfamily protein n=1 Tax=Erythroxylum novogranatense TaxID=1862640 RepID=A0AAV8SXA5_9ROSI|nr:hypothetical protein K2173_000364 [Erythroxylum novogranatense]
MEKIAAACALDWSIELEKSSRSKKPGRSLEGILQMGPRIQRWSREPAPTMAIYNMFGMIPGEDKLFANAILLRLADAFMSGDKDTRIAVVNVFLFELRSRDKKTSRKQYRGIFSKARMHNHAELLRRVKVVFDTGDIESRAFALVLFGCWADFAKDSAHLRYLILSTLVSSNVLEVKASLFAAGCFSELADDFATVVLQMLVNLVTSSDFSRGTRLAGLRVFSKMTSSFAVANEAYKTGLKLVSDFSDKELLVAILVSLTKLASKSTFLLSQQVDVLLEFLGPDKSLQLQSTVLRCLHILVGRGICHASVTVHAMKTLCRVAFETELPSSVQCQALQILCKILLGTMPDILVDNMHHLTHLLTNVQNSIQSPIKSKRLITICTLVDVSTKLSGRTEMRSNLDWSSLKRQIISVAVDQIIVLEKSLVASFPANTRLFKEIQCLLNVLLFLVAENPNLGDFVLDKIRFFIEHLVDKNGSIIAARQASLKLVAIVQNFSLTCIESLHEVDAISEHILDQLKLLVESVHNCSLFDCYTQIIYSILLQSHMFLGFMINPNRKTFNPGIILGNLPLNHLVKHVEVSLECAKKMLSQREYWPAFKSGRHAACQGAWIIAAFVFEQLITKVKSASCSYWLKLLTKFAQAERQIQLFVFQKQACGVVDLLEAKEFFNTCFWDKIGDTDVSSVGNVVSLTEMLHEAYNKLASSGEFWEYNIILEQSFCFQRWFLALRAKLLRVVADLSKLLDSSQLNQENASDYEQVETSVTANYNLQQVTQISLQLMSIAQELDLIAVSFIDMDRRSSKIISELAFGCSILAFTTGIALLTKNLSGNDNLATLGLETSNNYLKEMFIQSLIARLWLIDQEACSNLSLLLELSGLPKSCASLQPRSHIWNTGAVRDILQIFYYAISGIVHLQKEGKLLQYWENLPQVSKDHLQLLLNIITKWMRIPFRFPRFFFKVRPCTGSELFAFSEESRIPNELSVSPGFHLSLNLCLQLRNLTPDCLSRVSKLYCLLYSGVSLKESRATGETTGPMQPDYRTWETENRIQMNDKLFNYVVKNCKPDRDKDADTNNRVEVFVCFELYDKGQGFASCLLDVSHFPVGSYRIKWHSCCIDSQGSYWSLLPLNSQPIFTVQ